MTEIVATPTKLGDDILDHLLNSSYDYKHLNPSDLDKITNHFKCRVETLLKNLSTYPGNINLLHKVVIFPHNLDFVKYLIKKLDNENYLNIKGKSVNSTEDVTALWNSIYYPEGTINPITKILLENGAKPPSLDEYDLYGIEAIDVIEKAQAEIDFERDEPERISYLGSGMFFQSSIVQFSIAQCSIVSAALEIRGFSSFMLL